MVDEARSGSLRPCVSELPTDTQECIHLHLTDYLLARVSCLELDEFIGHSPTTDRARPCFSADHQRAPGSDPLLKCPDGVNEQG